MLIFPFWDSNHSIYVGLISLGLGSSKFRMLEWLDWGITIPEIYSIVNSLQLFPPHAVSTYKFISCHFFISNRDCLCPEIRITNLPQSILTCAYIGSLRSILAHLRAISKIALIKGFVHKDIERSDLGIAIGSVKCLI